MFRRLFLLFLVTFFTPGIAVAEKATVLNQPNAPLEIQRYFNRYKAPERVGDGTIIHRATVQNTSSNKIEAYGLGFYIFDAFNRDMGRPFVGYAMDAVTAEATATPGWEQRPNSAFLFRRHGHGLAYVAIVRLEDGSVWRPDISSITRQLEDFELMLSDE